MKCLIYLELLLGTALLMVSCSGSDTSDTDSVPVTSTKEIFSKTYLADRTFYSKLMGKIVKYSVILPQVYIENNTANYPVVFLFHGYGDGAKGWTSEGIGIEDAARTVVRQGTMQPCIFVIPDVGNTYFCNRYDGAAPVMDMLTKELVPEVDRLFRTTAKASERAVMGYSMGGFGALSIVAQHPEIFNICVSLSPSMNTDEQYMTLSQDGFNIQWGNNFGGTGKAGNSRLSNYYLSQCPLHIFEDKDASLWNGLNFFIDCGDDEERLYEGSLLLHSIMRKKNINHEFRMRNGAHTTQYWRSALPEAFRFIEESFAGKNHSPAVNCYYRLTTENERISTLDVNGLQLSIIKPISVNKGNSTFIYVSLGGNPIVANASTVAQAMDSLLSQKDATVICFYSDDAQAKNIMFSQIVTAVEGERQVLPSNRFAVIYGAKAGLLWNATQENNPWMKSLFCLDADLSTLSLPTSQTAYFLESTDEATYYESMSKVFCACRAAGCTVQNRIRGGTDDTNSFLNILREFSELMYNFVD